MRTSFLLLIGAISAPVLCGCTKAGLAPDAAVYHVRSDSLLDNLLSDSQFSNAIAHAQVDLPDDAWEDSPFRYNSSRDRREFAVATNILASLEPILRLMTVRQLVGALKVLPYPSAGQFTGVTNFVYSIGNERIIKEIRARPPSQLSVLPSLASDKVEVYEGPQGFSDTLSEILRSILASKKSGSAQTNGAKAVRN